MTRGTRGGDAFAAALALLTGRSLTTGELAERLRRRGHDPAEVARACERAAACGCLDDRRAAASWAEVAVRVRGFGPRRVREGLARRILPADVIEEAVGAVFGEGEEGRAARAALARWERARGAPTGERRRAAAYAHLLRRGFSAAAARSALFSDPESE